MARHRRRPGSDERPDIQKVIHIRTQYETESRGSTVDVHIRPATGDDVDALVDLGRRVFRSTYLPVAGEEYVELGLAKWWSPSAVMDEVRAGRTLLAELEGQVVALVSWSRSQGRTVIWKLYVLADLQRSGIGSALLNTLCARLVEDGHDEVYLSYAVGTERTRRWLDGLGFVEAWQDPGHDVVPTQVWTRKILVPSAAAAASTADQWSDADS